MTALDRAYTETVTDGPGASFAITGQPSFHSKYGPRALRERATAILYVLWVPRQQQSRDANRADSAEERAGHQARVAALVPEGVALFVAAARIS